MMDFGKNTIRIAGVALVILVAGAWYVVQNGENCSGTNHPAGSDCMPDEIILLGNIDVRQVGLAFKVPGRIEKILLEEGDIARKGQSVALLEQADFADDVALAEARLNASKALLNQLENGARPQEIEQAKALVAERRATLANARSTHQRRKELAEQGFTAHQSHEDAEAAMQQAEARLNSAIESLELVEAGPRAEEIEQARAASRADAARLALAKRRLVDTEIFAPNEGIILTRVREPGAIVAAGETICNLSLKSPVWVRSYIEEPDLGHVKPGMRAEVRTDSGGSYLGQVGFISPVAEFTPKSVETRALRTSLVYRVRVVIEDSDDGLRQGMPVTVTIKPNGNRGAAPLD